MTRSQNPHYIFTAKQAKVLVNNGMVATQSKDIVSNLTLAKSFNKPIVILGTTSLITDVLSNIDKIKDIIGGKIIMRKGIVVKPCYSLRVGEVVYVQEASPASRPSFDLYRAPNSHSFVFATRDVEMLNDCIQFD